MFLYSGLEVLNFLKEFKRWQPWKTSNGVRFSVSTNRGILSDRHAALQVEDQDNQYCIFMTTSKQALIKNILLKEKEISE